MIKETNFMLESNGCMLNVTTHINDNASGVIVVLHGGPGSGADPIIALPAFKKLSESFTMVYFDQRGSGRSNYDLNMELTIEHITGDVKAVVDYAKSEFAGKQVYLWGGSFGGLLSLLFLQKYPTAVDKAIISSPAIHPCNEEIRQFQLQYIQNEFVKLLPTPLAEQTKSTIALDSDFTAMFGIDDFKKWIEENNKPVKNHEAVWHMYAMRNWFGDCDMRSSIQDIKIKALFLMGMEDPIIPVDELVNTFSQYPNDNISLKTFSQCGHAIFEDCTEEFCEVCTEFYRKEL